MCSPVIFGFIGIKHIQNIPCKKVINNLIQNSTEKYKPTNEQYKRSTKDRIRLKDNNY